MLFSTPSYFYFNYRAPNEICIKPSDQIQDAVLRITGELSVKASIFLSGVKLLEIRDAIDRQVISKPIEMVIKYADIDGIDRPSIDSNHWFFLPSAEIKIYGDRLEITDSTPDKSSEYYPYSALRGSVGVLANEPRTYIL